MEVSCHSSGLVDVYICSEIPRLICNSNVKSLLSLSSGMAYFHGPWFVTPHEMTHLTNTAFYPQESFLSTISDANPLLSVVGRAAVMETKDYVLSRPTAFAENDVYVCESVYDESKRMIRGALENGLKVYEHSPVVQVDEVYYFKSPISLKRVSGRPVSWFGGRLNFLSETFAALFFSVSFIFPIF